MKYVLDTNVVSALMTEDAKVLSRLKEHERRDVSVPQPVLAEIAYGIARLAKSKRKDKLRTRFELIRKELLVASWSDAVSDAFGVIKANLERDGVRIEDFDVAIAAHARAHSAVLVTANVKHMSRVADLVVEDWTD
ncbi:MAG TPA: type II toxin-antitoxin system VapC family toxin [Kofleriaceae bacterium]